MKALSVFLVTLLFTNLLRGQEPPLRITVITGDGARHNFNQKVRIEPVVQVDDENGKPVEGAAVVFAMPNRGPGGLFENGSRLLTVTTDPQGRATAHGIRLDHLKGPFEIKVTASYQGHGGATVAIAQEAYSGPTHSGRTFGISTKEWVVASLTLLAIGGAIFAVKEFKPGANPNVLTATPGTPVVGGPQ